MGTCVMFGKYTCRAMEEMSPGRTEKANNLIKKLDGEVVSTYALLGEQDLICIINFPGIEQAMKAAIALGKLTGILFTTSPAVTVDEFDKIIADV